MTCMKRPASMTLVAVTGLAVFAANVASAALTFDLQAVSGSQVTIHGAKSVGVNQDSVGGWIDFELWGTVTGSNHTATDDWMQNFAGSMHSDQFGNGAIAGSMVNTGEIAPGVRRGIASQFDGTGHQAGALRNLDSDPDLEIGGRSETVIGYGTNYLLAGRTGGSIQDTDGGEVAEFLLYRFTLPIEGINATSLDHMTQIRFEPYEWVAAHLWFEDGQPFNGGSGVIQERSGVLIHTAQTAAELAMIPEPCTWLLALLGVLSAGWFAKSRRH